MPDKEISSFPCQRIIRRYSKNETDFNVSEKEDTLSTEQPFEIRVRSAQQKSTAKSIAVLMRSPGDDLELALGFLFNEGIISGLDEFVSHELHTDYIVCTLQHGIQDKLQHIERNFFSSSSCGICSKASAEQLKLDSSYLSWSSTLKIEGKHLFDIRRYFEKHENQFKKTGSIHGCILLDKDFNFVTSFEDIGRHNTLDKLSGYALQKKILPLHENILLLSGRISFEMVQKASMTGVALIIALGAPSQLAVEEAEAHNICLIGFAKERSFNVYSGFERIV